MIRLQPKMLQRIRDHLLESGQPQSVALGSDAPQKSSLDEVFSGDPDARRRFEAMFEAMYLMVAADGSVGEKEREVLRGAVREVTANGLRSAEIDALSDACATRLQGSTTSARLQAIAPTLREDPILAEAAFALSAAVAFADSEIRDEENEFVNQLADALIDDPNRAEQILNEIDQIEE